MEQAIARDPNYGLALSFASICYFRLVFDGRSEDPHADGARSVDLARRGLLAARDDPMVMAHAAAYSCIWGRH